MMIPRIPIGRELVNGINFLSDNLHAIFSAISSGINAMVGGVYDVLAFLPPVLLVALVALISWKAARLHVAAFSVASLSLIYSMRLWDATLHTLALVFVATAIALFLGIPMGILKARKPVVSTLLEPLLDFMQTLPSLSYLIPAVLFFGIGEAPGVVATVIFAMPPAIRLTCLGIEQVSEQIVEVGTSFGSTSRQILTKIELPIAMPSIAMGINQTIMLAFSMVVIAGFIGAGGLGEVIISGIQRYSLVHALEAGLSVVFLAIILDRITKAIARIYEH